MRPNEKSLPVPLILDMWAYGCTATTISHALGIKSYKTVAKVIEQARSIGDKRATIHAYGNGRKVGRVDRAAAISDRDPAIRSVAIVSSRY